MKVQVSLDLQSTLDCVVDYWRRTCDPDTGTPRPPTSVMDYGSQHLGSGSLYSSDPLWRSSSPRPGEGAVRSPMPGELTPYPVGPSGVDLEPLSNMFSFTSPYKDLPLFKEKGSHDIADALLSLKHAVVHPGQVGGPLSPLSPGLPPHPFSQAPNPSTSFTYSVSHPQHPSQMFGNYGNMSGQYPPSQYAPDTPPPMGQTSPGSAAGGGMGAQCQGGMFPSMSVNVSMSMNVGMPGPNGHHPQMGSMPDPQWGHHQPAPHPQYPPPPPPPPQGPMSGYQPPAAQYHGYNSQGQPYHHHSYAFADLRSPVSAAKDVAPVFYRPPTADSYKGMSKFYALNSLSMRRAGGGKHMISGRTSASGLETGKVNLCRICGKTYARPSTLKTHMRTHSGEKPYRCQTCSKTFSQAANLTAHIRTHSGEKPFRCPVCERRFSQSSSVTTHMRTHSGERPYRCRMCKKAFSDSSTLTKHLRIHSGEKPYQCKLCLLRFSQSGNLNRHMRVHANNA